MLVNVFVILKPIGNDTLFEIILRVVFPLISQLHVLLLLLWVRYTEMYVQYSEFCYTEVLLHLVYVT